MLVEIRVRFEREPDGRWLAELVEPDWPGVTGRGWSRATAMLELMRLAEDVATERAGDEV